MTNDATPSEAGSNEGLGALPEPDVTTLSDYFDASGERHSLAYSIDAVRKLLAERDALQAALDAVKAESLKVVAQIQAERDGLAKDAARCRQQALDDAALMCDSVYHQHIGPQHGEVRYGIAACAAAIRALKDKP